MSWGVGSSEFGRNSSFRRGGCWETSYTTDEALTGNSSCFQHPNARQKKATTHRQHRTRTLEKTVWGKTKRESVVAVGRKGSRMERARKKGGKGGRGVMRVSRSLKRFFQKKTGKQRPKTCGTVSRKSSSAEKRRAEGVEPGTGSRPRGCENIRELRLWTTQGRRFGCDMGGTFDVSFA